MTEKLTGLLSPEIGKLSEKLQKDPTSKIFFNLAEEYLKAGMIDEALSILISGLKSNPNYLSAKVLLGKIFFDQQKIKDAQEVFEQILKVNPDNSVANKKLALIYFNEKNWQEAEKCCNQILFFNPKDKETLDLFQKIKKIKEGSEKASISEIQLPKISETPTEMAVDLKEDKNPPSPVKTGESGISREPVLQESVPVQKASSEPKPIHRIPDDPLNDSINFSDIMKEEEINSPPNQEKKVEKKEEVKENLETIGLAALYIKQGHYDKGVEVYKKLLEQDPYNESIRQQLEDAKAVGHLLGMKQSPQQVEEKILKMILPEEFIKPNLTRSNGISPPVKEISAKKQAKINQLKDWLELIKKIE